MKNYESKLDMTWQFFLLSLEEQFPHISKTEKLILDILSLQKNLFWHVEKEAWVVPKKRKRKGKFHIDAFAKKFLPSEN